MISSYSGNHVKLQNIVNQVNQIIKSPFYTAEVREYLIQKKRGCYFGLFNNLLENDKQIIVKIGFNPFSTKKINTKDDFILVHPIAFKAKYRELIELLIEAVYTLIISNTEILSFSNFEQERNKKTFLKEVGEISKHYVQV